MILISAIVESTVVQVIVLIFGVIMSVMGFTEYFSNGRLSADDETGIVPGSPTDKLADIFTLMTAAWMVLSPLYLLFGNE